MAFEIGFGLKTLLFSKAIVISTFIDEASPPIHLLELKVVLIIKAPLLFSYPRSEHMQRNRFFVLVQPAGELVPVGFVRVSEVRVREFINYLVV